MDNLAANAKTIQDLRSSMSSATKLNLLRQAEEYNMNTYGQNVGGKGTTASVKNAAKSLITGKPLAAVGAVAEAAAEASAGSDKARNKAIKKSYENSMKLQAQANGEAPINSGKFAGIKEKLSNIKDANIAQGAKNLAGKAAGIANNATANLNNESLANFSLAGMNTLGNQAQQFANKQMGKAEAERSKDRLENARTLANAQNEYDNALADYNAQEANYNAQMAQSQASSMGSQLDRISAAMELALNAGDITAYGQLADLYKQAAEIESLANPTAKANAELSSSQKTKLNEIDTSMNTLNQLKNAYEQAGGGKGLVGNLSEFANSITGGAANRNLATYNDLKNSLGMAIVKNVISAGGTEQDAKRYIAMLPSASDTPEQAAQKFAYLEDMLNNAKQSVYNY